MHDSHAQETPPPSLGWPSFGSPQDANCQNVADWFQGFADVRECHGPRKKGRKTGSKAADAKVRLSFPEYWPRLGKTVLGRACM